MNDDIKHSILKARAKQLSLPDSNRTESPIERIEVVKFKIGVEEYAIATKDIREVYQIKEFTPLPLVANFVVGLINVRRKVLSLLDLGNLFNLPRPAEIIGSRAIIIAFDDAEFALLVGEIECAQTIDSQDILPLPPSLNGIRQELTIGVTCQGCTLLDAHKIANHPALIVNEAD